MSAAGGGSHRAYDRLDDLDASEALDQYASGRLFKQQWSTASIELPDMQFARYNTADTRDLLVRYIHPRVVIVDRIWKWIGHTRLSPDVNYSAIFNANTRMFDEYCHYRKSIIKTIQSRSKMTFPQRLALLALFHCSLSFRTLLVRYDAERRREKWPSETEAQDFDFVVALSAVDVPLAVSNQPIATYSLTKWNTAIDLLTRAISVSGATTESPISYWEALWDRYARLVHDLPTAAQERGELLHPNHRNRIEHGGGGDDASKQAYLELLSAFGVVEVIAPALDTAIPHSEMSRLERAALFKSTSSILDYADAIEDAGLATGADDTSATFSTALHEFIDIQHENARLKFSFCMECESRYYTLTTRSETLSAFIKASRERPAMMEKTHVFIKLWRSDARGGGKNTMIKFVLSSLRNPDQNLQRYLRDSIWSEVGSAHLFRGQAELHLVIRAEILRSRQVEDVTINEGIGHVSPERIIADMDPAVYQGMTKFLRDRQLEVNIVDGYLKHDDTDGMPPTLRTYSERMSILAITKILDGNMILAGCNENSIFSASSYIEELHENTDVPTVFPLSASDAMSGRGKHTRCAVVRTLRRNFVVVGGTSRIPTTTFELPTFEEAICFWLAYAKNIPMHHIPTDLHALIIHIREKLAEKRPSVVNL